MAPPSLRRLFPLMRSFRFLAPLFSLFVVLTAYGCGYLRGVGAEGYRYQERLERKVTELTRSVEALKKRMARVERARARSDKRLSERLAAVEKRLDDLEKSSRGFPYDKSLVADALYALADSYYRQGEFEEAILEFQKFIDMAPNHRRIPSAYLKQGLSLIYLGRAKDARFFFETLIDKYPDSEEAAVAREKLKLIEKGGS